MEELFFKGSREASGRRRGGVKPLEGGIPEVSMKNDLLLTNETGENTVSVFCRGNADPGLPLAIWRHGISRRISGFAPSRSFGWAAIIINGGL